jgi:hypothetical protein
MVAAVGGVGVMPALWMVILAVTLASVIYLGAVLDQY